MQSHNSCMGSIGTDSDSHSDAYEAIIHNYQKFTLNELPDVNSFTYEKSKISLNFKSSLSKHQVKGEFEFRSLWCLGETDI